MITWYRTVVRVDCDPAATEILVEELVKLPDVVIQVDALAPCAPILLRACDRRGVGVWLVGPSAGVSTLLSSAPESIGAISAASIEGGAEGLSPHLPHVEVQEPLFVVTREGHASDGDRTTSDTVIALGIARTLAELDKHPPEDFQRFPVMLEYPTTTGPILVPSYGGTQAVAGHLALVGGRVAFGFDDLHEYLSWVGQNSRLPEGNGQPFPAFFREVSRTGVKVRDGQAHEVLPTVDDHDPLLLAFLIRCGRDEDAHHLLGLDQHSSSADGWIGADALPDDRLFEFAERAACQLARAILFLATARLDEACRKAAAMELARLPSQVTPGIAEKIRGRDPAIGEPARRKTRAKVARGLANKVEHDARLHLDLVRASLERLLRAMPG